MLYTYHGFLDNSLVWNLENGSFDALTKGGNKQVFDQLGIDPANAPSLAIKSLHEAFPYMSEWVFNFSATAAVSNWQTGLVSEWTLEQGPHVARGRRTIQNSR